MLFLSYNVVFVFFIGVRKQATHAPKSFMLYIQNKHFVAKNTVNLGLIVGRMLEHLSYKADTVHTDTHGV